MTLAKIYRLAPSKKIEEVKSNGNLYQSNNFGVVIDDRKNKEVSRFAFIVSKKVSNLAVHRNRIERALHEAVRRNLSRLDTGFDLVFLTKVSCEKMSSEEIIREVELFFSKMKFLKRP